MKLADQTAIADEHLDCAIRAVRARTGGNAQPAPELVSAYMRSMAMIQLSADVQALVDELRSLDMAIGTVGVEVSAGAELIANAVGD